MSARAGLAGGLRAERDDAAASVVVVVGCVLLALRPLASLSADSRVVLFGSHARGTAAEDSDYDVLVIEPTVESALSESVRLRRELRGLGVPIDVVVMDEAKARRRAAVPGTMVERALREGRLLART